MQARPFNLEISGALGLAVSLLLCASLSQANPLDAGLGHPAELPVLEVSTEQRTATSKSPPAQQDPAAVRFVQSCLSCHTIGGGATRGPDLAGVAGWPEPQLIAAIRAMERKVGPLGDETISALAELLADKNARARVEAVQESSRRAPSKQMAPPNSRLGGSLFFGLTPLSNGGMPCNACHRFHGEGGTLGPDLTHGAHGIPLEALAGSIARAGFPVMRGAYKDHPITETEARHLAAFMQQATSARRAPRDSRLNWSGIGLGVSAFLAAVVYIVARPRGVRARLVKRATKR